MSELDTHQDLFDLRKKVLDGEEVSPEEYSRVIESLRSSRTASEPKSTKNRASKGKTPAKEVDLGALLSGKI